MARKMNIDDDLTTDGDDRTELFVTDTCFEEAWTLKDLVHKVDVAYLEVCQLRGWLDRIERGMVSSTVGGLVRKLKRMRSAAEQADIALFNMRKFMEESSILTEEDFDRITSETDRRAIRGCDEFLDDLPEMEEKIFKLIEESENKP